MRGSILLAWVLCGCAAGNAGEGAGGGDGGASWSGPGGAGPGGAGPGAGGPGGNDGGSGGAGGAGGGMGGMGGDATGGMTASGGAGGMGGQGGSGDITPPTVVATTPADGASAIGAWSAITVTFSEPMASSTINAGTSTSCSGSIQLSFNNFASCVPLTGTATTSDDISFVVTPAGPLASATDYSIRVTTMAADAALNTLAAPYQTPAGFTVRYARSIVIDGINDFGPENAFTTSTGGTGYLSYDDTHLYLGLAHPDILAAGSGNKFAYFLLSTDVTLATGNTLSSDGKAKFGSAGTQRMSHYYKEQIDGSVYSEYGSGDGTTWSTAWGTQGKSSYRAAGYLEASIALSELMNPSAVIVTGYTIDYDGDNGNGWVYHLPLGATDGSSAQPVDLMGYAGFALPTSNVPNHTAHQQLF